MAVCELAQNTVLHACHIASTGVVLMCGASLVCCQHPRCRVCIAFVLAVLYSPSTSLHTFLQCPHPPSSPLTHPPHAPLPHPWKQISVDRQGKKYKKQIRGVGDRGADETYFYNEQLKKEQSVAAYFSTTYNLRLQFPKLPPVNVSSDPGKKNWQPMELCS